MYRLSNFVLCVQFAGALLLGRGVSKTISKGLADPEYFQDIPEVLMWGMFSALFAAGTWLLIATALEMPVSTTHSIVGCDLRRMQIVACT